MNQDLILSKAELRLLNKINRTGSISLDDTRTETADCKALYRYGLLQTADLSCYPPQKDGIYSKANSLSITQDGIQYLRLVKKESKKQVGYWVRYTITTLIAVCALILSAISIAAQLGLIQLLPT